MPELPEVETIRRDLLKTIKGKTFRSVEVKVAKLVRPKPGKFKRKIKDLKVLDIKRRAKVLILKLSQDLSLLVHLKLTGQLIYRDKKGRLGGGGHSLRQDLQKLPNKFSHVIFEFTDDSLLFFNDIRKFGWLRLVDKREEQAELASFGLEPLSQEFTLARFQELLAKRPKAKIKQVLMDQSLIAGIGNIYSDEACFYAQIRPARSASSLNQLEIKKLRQAIVKVLKLSLVKRGTSVDTYVDAYGAQGEFEKYLKIYRKTGQRCARCRAIIKRITLGGRSSHFCPKCQW